MAEKEGFEPSIPFWGIHDFQSCALGQLRDFSITVLSVQPGYNTTGNPICQAQISLFREFLPRRFSAGRWNLLWSIAAKRPDGIAYPHFFCRYAEARIMSVTENTSILWHKSIDKEVLSSLQNRQDEKRRTFTGYGVFLYVPYSHALYQRRSAGGSVIGSRISPPRAPCPTGRSLQS